MRRGRLHGSERRRVVPRERRDAGASHERSAGAGAARDGGRRHSAQIAHAGDARRSRRFARRAQMARSARREAVLHKILLHLRLNAEGEHRPDSRRRDGIPRRALHGALPRAARERQNGDGRPPLRERRAARRKPHEKPPAHADVGQPHSGADAPAEQIRMPRAAQGGYGALRRRNLRENRKIRRWARAFLRNPRPIRISITKTASA